MSHFQGCISAVVVFYTSDDIRRQMKLVLRCNFSDDLDDHQQQASAYGRTSGTSTRISNRSLDRSRSRSLDQEESEPRKAQGSTSTEADKEQDVESRPATNNTNYSNDDP